jgi:cell division protein FtsZ
LNDKELLEFPQDDVTKEDLIGVSDSEPEAKITPTDSPQQALNLEDEDHNISSTDVLTNSGTTEDVETIPQITEEKKIVFELDIDEEESPEEVITDIMEDENLKAEMETVVLELDNELAEDILETIESAPVSPDAMKIEARERENRLREISQQLRTPSGLTDLEDVPAYKRNNVELEETTHSGETEISTYTLSDGKDNTPEVKQNNSFLHDNVD